MNHLQTEAAIQWARENLYIPTRVCGYGRDFGKGEVWVESMLRGHPERIKDTLRVTPCQFENAAFKSRYVSSKVKLAIFLYIIAQNAPWRIIREHFGVSLRTVKRAFYEVLDGLAKHLYASVVRMPPIKCLRRPKTTRNECRSLKAAVELLMAAIYQLFHWERIKHRGVTEKALCLRMY